MSECVVLCVDDDATLLQALRALLSQQLGPSQWIEIAESADEALEICRELRDQGRHLAVVISDYIMPGMRGDELLARLHLMAPATAKIMLSGQSDLAGVQRAMREAELYRFIEKPFVNDELVSATRAAVQAYWQKLALLTLSEPQTDALGGLCTRPQLERILSERLDAAAPALADAPLCVTLIDLDPLEGERQGVAERPLLALVRLLQGQQREADVVGRWSGEAFMVISAGIALQDARAQAEALRQRLATQAIEGLSAATFGVACSRPGESASDLIERASLALQKARAAGRSWVGVAD